MKRNKLFATVVAFSLVASALGQAPSGEALAGEWKGECDRCAAQGFTLVFSGAGKDLTGTIKAEGTPTFGNSVKPIEKIKQSGSKVEFEAKGDSGDPFYVELKISPDGKELRGDGSYRRTNFGLRFWPASR